MSAPRTGVHDKLKELLLYAGVLLEDQKFKLEQLEIRTIALSAALSEDGTEKLPKMRAYKAADFKKYVDVQGGGLPTLPRKFAKCIDKLQQKCVALQKKGKMNVEFFLQMPVTSTKDGVEKNLSKKYKGRGLEQKRCMHEGIDQQPNRLWYSTRQQRFDNFWRAWHGQGALEPAREDATEPLEAPYEFLL